MMKVKKRSLWILLGVVLLLVLVTLMPKITGNFLFFGSESKGTQNSQPQGEVKQVQLTKDNFNLFLMQQPIVKALPEEAVILFRMYNFDTGVRQWDKSYVITKGSVREGTIEKPDFDIIISSKYMYLIAQDMCSAVKKAKANGDFAVDTSLGKTAILWKYKSMMEYRDCFGF